MHRSSRKLLECTRRLPDNRPSSLPPLFVTPFVKPRTKWKIGRTNPLTSRSYSRVSYFHSPTCSFLSSSSSSVVARDSPSLRRGRSPCASLNSMCQEIRPLRSATAYPSGIIRSKELGSASQRRRSRRTVTLFRAQNVQHGQEIMNE